MEHKLINDALNAFQDAKRQQQLKLEHETRALFERCFPGYPMPELEGEVLHFNDFVLQRFRDGFYLLDAPATFGVNGVPYPDPDCKIVSLESLGREVARRQEQRAAQPAARGAPSRRSEPIDSDVIQVTQRIRDLYQDLFAKCRGDKETVNSLIQYERERAPTGNMEEWLQRAIEHWEHDNR
jgi:hypothetical protein